MSKIYVDSIASKTGAADAIDISSTGIITMPKKPAFSVSRRTSNQAISNTNEIVQFNSVEFDVGSDFNTSTYSFVAPVAGAYHFCFNLYIYSVTQAEGFIYRNGVSEYRFANLAIGTASNPNFASGHVNMYCAEGDAISVWAWASSAAAIYAGNTTSHFSGHLIG